MALLKKKTPPETAVEIPVLCKIWEEDGVFNGIAEDLAVAVFGKTYEEAHKHLGEAIVAHLEALQELHQLESTIKRLRSLERELYLTSQELPRNQSLFRFSAALHGRQVLALV